jgi:hypothetical protein
MTSSKTLIKTFDFQNTEIQVTLNNFASYAVASYFDRRVQISRT